MDQGYPPLTSENGPQLQEKNLHRKPYRGHPTLAAATTVRSHEAMVVKVKTKVNGS
jgi:hypothetical protein